MATIEVIPNSEVEFADVSMEGDRLSGRPVFYGDGKGLANVLTILVRDKDGVTARRYLLRISGKNYAVTLQERSNPSVAAIENPEADKPAKATKTPA